MGNEVTAWSQYSILATWATSFCAFILIILILLDAYKAFRKKAHWIPAEVMVLNALLIQLLAFIDNLDLNVNSEVGELKNDQLGYLIEFPVDIYIIRVMICLFIGYLLPRVVRSGLRSVWGDIGALALIVTWHMGYEVYFLLTVMKEEKSWNPPPPGVHYREYLGWSVWLNRVCFIISHITIFTTLVLLVVLLTGASMAGKSIHKLMSQKVPLALSCCCSYQEKKECKNIENHVLKCWIVARASQPDYIIARSVFSSFAGLVITACVMLLGVLCMCNSYILKDYFTSSIDSWMLSNVIYYLLQFAFIIIGWIMVLFRWFTAVIYFPRDRSYFFHLEDFWTMCIVDMKNDLDAHLTARLFHKKGNLSRPATQSIVVYLITTLRLHSLLLIMGIWLQKVMVSCSKACWCLSSIVLEKLRPCIMSSENNALLCGLNLEEIHPFNKYKEALDVIRMPGENASSLWIANLSALKKAEDNMTRGFEINKNTCVELIDLMVHKTGMVEDEAPTSLLNEKHFQEICKKSWKMRAVSLIHFMIYFYDGTNINVVNDAIQACSQAWCFMDIVDNLDQQPQLVSLAADKHFETMEKIWNDHRQTDQSNENVSEKIKLLEEKIKSPLKHQMEQLSKEEIATDNKVSKSQWVENLHHSRDWMAVAVEISLYKTWKTMDHNSNSVNAINRLKSLLANIIAHCIGKQLDIAFIESCGKWAEDGKENEIFNAAFIAGKAKAVRAKTIETNHIVRDQIEVRVDDEGNEVVHSPVETAQ